MRGGKRQGAGRKPGSKVKATASIREHTAKLIASGEKTPLEFLLEVMRSPEPQVIPDEDTKVFFARYSAWNSSRLEAAKAAAPYCHPKLANVEHSGPGGGPIAHEVTI